MRRPLLALTALLLATAPAASEPEKKTVKQARLYAQLLFDSGSPPFASARQPLTVEINIEGEDICEPFRKAKITTDAQSKKLKACIVAARKRFTSKLDTKAYFEEKPYTDFLNLFDKKTRARVKAASKGMTIVEGQLTGDGETLSFYFGLNAEYSIRGIWIETEAVE